MGNCLTHTKEGEDNPIDDNDHLSNMCSHTFYAKKDFDVFLDIMECQCQTWINLHVLKEDLEKKMKGKVKRFRVSKWTDEHKNRFV